MHMIRYCSHLRSALACSCTCISNAQRRGRRAVQASADGVGKLSEEDAEAMEAAVMAARGACEALQRKLLDGELKTYAALGSLLGQAERRHADAAEAARQHVDTFFGTARTWPLAHRIRYGTLHTRCATSATHS